MSRANTPLEGGFESLHKDLTNSLVGTDIQTQLTTSTDVTAAHDFFKAPAGAQAYLPEFSGFESSAATPVSGGGAEAFAAKAVGAEAGALAKVMTPTGAEASLLQPPGLEASAFAGMQPGADPMNPLIQLILKMPGALGMLQDFFEFLGALFLNPMETLMHSVFDPSSWFSHAAEGLGELGGDHVINMGLVPGDAPIFANTGHHGSLFESMGRNSDPLQFGPDYNDLTVGGLPEGKPLFESTSQDLNFNFQGQQLAFDNGSNQFQPSFGAPTATPTVMPSQTTAQDLYNQTMDQSMQRGDLLNPGANASPTAPPAEATTAQSTDAAKATTDAPVEAPTEAYCVKSGDNLWDIAREKLGDGQRWGEIYKMNTNVIGENPRLIMPGTDLQLPGGDHSLASTGAENYVVKSGDNLWNISKDHMGGGEHWPDVYHQNADVVGSNPDMIHPGQELKIDHSQVAHNHDLHGTHTAHHGGSHHGGSHHGGSHHGGSHHGSHQQVAHNNHSAHHGTQGSHAQGGGQHADKTVAEGKPDTQAQATPAQAQTDYATGSGAAGTSTPSVGLKTTQTMGSLDQPQT